jgi:hypothetical protein
MEFKYFNIYDKFDIWRKKNNISREKLELFHDFVISLDNLIEDTYLGADVIDDDKKIKGHFTWCWNKIIDDFEKEKIYFKRKGTHFVYFFSFFNAAFYEKEIDFSESRIHFDELFNIMEEKSDVHLELLLDLYKILDLNLIK